jgi:hypothetical protein
VKSGVKLRGITEVRGISSALLVNEGELVISKLRGKHD